MWRNFSKEQDERTAEGIMELEDGMIIQNKDSTSGQGDKEHEQHLLKLNSHVWISHEGAQWFQGLTKKLVTGDCASTTNIIIPSMCLPSIKKSLFRKDTLLSCFLRASQKYCQ